MSEFLNKTELLDEFTELFEQFGNVTSAVIQTDEEGNSKGFGFVTFEDNSPEGMLVGRSGLVLDEKQVRA